MKLGATLRYGENPHQAAAFYTDLSLGEHGLGGVATAEQLHGKELSYNNYLDADAAYSTVCDLAEPGCVIVKHTNPCGVAVRDDLLEAYRLAVRADPTSAFGGIVAFNRWVGFGALHMAGRRPVHGPGRALRAIARRLASRQYHCRGWPASRHLAMSAPGP